MISREMVDLLYGEIIWELSKKHDSDLIREAIDVVMERFNIPITKAILLIQRWCDEYPGHSLGKLTALVVDSGLC